MTDTAGSPPQASDLGVVDPIRVPGAGIAGGLWARLPLLGRVFVALALVDIVTRAFGIFGERLPIDAGVPFTVVTAFLPHDALILLPAVILARRPDAASATPVILRGAIVVALVELLRGPLTALPFGAERGDPFASWALLASLATLLFAAGWVALAVGLSRLTPPDARPSIAGFSNLAAGTLVAGAGAWLLELFIGAIPVDLGEPSWDSMFLLVSAVAPVQLVAWAVVARVAVRGIGDVRRPAAATVLAATAMTLAAIAAALVVVETVVLAAQYLGLLGTAMVAGTLSLGWFGGGFVPTALVVAFGLGLADTSVRIPMFGAAPAAPSGPDVEPVRWPAPGGDVPAFRDPPPPAAHPTAGSRPRSTSKPKEPHA